MSLIISNRSSHDLGSCTWGHTHQWF